MSSSEILSTRDRYVDNHGLEISVRSQYTAFAKTGLEPISYPVMSVY